MLRYRALTSMVARVQFVGSLVFSSMFIRWPVLSMWESIVGTDGCKWRSTSFSVGPPQPLTIGLTDMGSLCIFFRK